MTEIPFIDLKAQYRLMRDDINKNIQQVLDHGQYIMGPEVDELETELAKFTKAGECITVSSGTDALLISLMALGVKHGDEVITTPFTFAATAEVIVRLGATPVFVDIDPETCNIDVGKIKAAITASTKVIMPVSLYGQTADMDEINDIAREYELAVVEDAAQSFGASYNGRRSCNISQIACTSFFPSKPLGCYGDGGAIFTNDPTLAAKCRMLRVHGQMSRYNHTHLGIGGRMDTIQCAILLAKLPYFARELEVRQNLGKQYNKAIDKLNIQRVQQRPNRESVFAQYTIMVENRGEVAEFLKKKHIPTSVHYPMSLHIQEAFREHCRFSELCVTEKMSERVLSLPMSPYLSNDQQSLIVMELEKATSRF